MTLVLQTDRTLIRAEASSARYLVASYTAPEAPATTDRLPVNLALVVDRSGSMSDAGKFPLAKEAVEKALRMLRPVDRFALIVYDDRCETLMPSTSATLAAQREALALLADIEPRGSTDLCAGWTLGGAQVAAFLSAERVSRVLLLTDGLANHGTVDPETLASHASRLRSRGISTSTFGVGADFDERLLDRIAHEGGGNAYFIQTASQIADFLTSEIGEALAVVARGAALEFETPFGASLVPLNRYRTPPRRSHGRFRIELGDLVSRQEVRAVLRVRFAPGEIGQHAVVHATLVGDGALMAAQEALIEWTYEEHQANDRQPRNREVDRVVAALYASKARAEATEANRNGDLRHARRVLTRTADRIDGYAGDDRVLQGEAARLRDDVANFALSEMSPMLRKMAYQEANSALKDRREDGRARRRG